MLYLEHWKNWLIKRVPEKQKWQKPWSSIKLIIYKPRKKQTKPKIIQTGVLCLISCSLACSNKTELTPMMFCLEFCKSSYWLCRSVLISNHSQDFAGQKLSVNRSISHDIGGVIAILWGNTGVLVWVIGYHSQILEYKVVMFQNSQGKDREIWLLGKAELFAIKCMCVRISRTKKIKNAECL